MRILDSGHNFLAIDQKYSNWGDSKIVILPAPYEHTVSYGGGAGNGPSAILGASAYVEFFDDEFERELCLDCGIATSEPLNFAGKVDRDALDVVHDAVSDLIAQDKFVVTLGGEHTISSAPIQAHFNKYPDMSILQFDAHSDLRDTYENSKYSHASIMARVAEFFPPEKITQAGIRALCREEFDFIKQHNINTFHASAIRRGSHGSNWQKAVVDTLGDEIYITFDVDFFDPAVMPATGTPEPDGFFYSETLDVFREIIARGKKIIGFDVVELAPVENLHHAELTTARLVYKILNYAFSNNSCK